MRFIINIIFLSIFFSCNAKPKETVEPEAKIPEPVTTAVAKKIADKYLTTETIETSFGNLFAIKADNITPHFVDSVAPDPNDKNIVLSIACAFTGERLDTFRTRNICGDYVTNGRFRKGYRGKYNTGYFLAYNGKFFIKKREDIQHAIDLAKKNKGQLFQQYLIINDGKVQGSIFKQDRIYRAVVIKNGELYVMQALQSQPFSDFANALVEAGAQQAIYTDMGGWQYGWYREANGSISPIGIPAPDTKFQTNWLIWKKKE